ncbi:MAG: hypothetical protein HZA80_02825 [Candidatus Taylorbacteria bacterium]|nr:hypothetical protein [Candidatus Taylorbacteria bacterium]
MNAVPFKEGDLVTFTSVHWHDCPINGLRAKIIEVRKTSLKHIFPEGLTICIQFQEGLRMTWCRVDELTKVCE